MRTAWKLCVAGLAAAAVWAAATAQEVEQASPATATASAPAMPEGVEVVAVSVEEVRRRSLGDSGRRWRVPSELKLTLHVVGEVPAKASRFGRVRVVRASDDKGTDLTGPGVFADRGQRRGFVTIDEWKRRGVRNGFVLELRLKPSARSAERIAAVTGSFTLQAGGRQRNVLVKNVLALAGQEVNDPLLQAAGVKLRIHEQTASGRKVAYVVEGNADVVLGSELVDAGGRLLRSMSGYRQVGSAPKVRYHTPLAKMPEGVGLRLTILSGAKLIEVPISLKDIPLP